MSRRRKRRAAPPEAPTESYWTGEDETDWEAEGRRIAIEGMDLPDGAYFAMMDDAGLDPY